METMIKSVRIPILTMRKLEEKGLDVSKEIKRMLEQMAGTSKCPTCHQTLKRGKNGRKSD